MNKQTLKLLKKTSSEIVSKNRIFDTRIDKIFHKIKQLNRNTGQFVGVFSADIPGKCPLKLRCFKGEWQLCGKLIDNPTSWVPIYIYTLKSLFEKYYIVPQIEEHFDSAVDKIIKEMNSILARRDE